MPLNALVEKLKTSEVFREWKFSPITEDTKEHISYLYMISREAKGIARAKIYLDQEKDENNLDKFGLACLVMNPLNRELEKSPDKQHFYDIGEFERYVLEKGIDFNRKYFTRQSNQGHNAPTQQSNS